MIFILQAQHELETKMTQVLERLSFVQGMQKTGGEVANERLADSTSTKVSTSLINFYKLYIPWIVLKFLQTTVVMFKIYDTMPHA